MLPANYLRDPILLEAERATGLPLRMALFHLTSLADKAGMIDLDDPEIDTIPDEIDWDRSRDLLNAAGYLSIYGKHAMLRGWYRMQSPHDKEKPRYPAPPDRFCHLTPQNLDWAPWQRAIGSNFEAATKLVADELVAVRIGDRLRAAAGGNVSPFADTGPIEELIEAGIPIESVIQSIHDWVRDLHEKLNSWGEAWLIQAIERDWDARPKTIAAEREGWVNRTGYSEGPYSILDLPPPTDPAVLAALSYDPLKCDTTLPARETPPQEAGANTTGQTPVAPAAPSYANTSSNDPELLKPFILQGPAVDRDNALPLGPDSLDATQGHSRPAIDPTSPPPQREVAESAGTERPQPAGEPSVPPPPPIPMPSYAALPQPTENGLGPFDPVEPVNMSPAGVPWEDILDGYAAGNLAWDGAWGPKPGAPGCVVPVEVLRGAGISPAGAVPSVPLSLASRG